LASLTWPDEAEVRALAHAFQTGRPFRIESSYLAGKYGVTLAAGFDVLVLPGTWRVSPLACRIQMPSLNG
jgi:hypothetical protein